MTRAIVKFLSIAGLAAAGAWFGSAPAWEPAVAVLALVAGFYGLEHAEHRAVARHTIDFRLFDSQSDATEHVTSLLATATPGIARLIGLSASKRHDLLEKLRRKGWRIELLIQHPSCAVDEKVRRNTEAFAAELLSTTFAGYDKIEIRLYRDICVLRGTHLAGLGISLGWYTLDPGPYGLRGHENREFTDQVQQPLP